MNRICIISVLVLLCSCENTKTKVQTNSKMHLTTELMQLVDSFTKQNNDEKFYEIYIDRVTEDSSTITLHSGDCSICNDENRILQISPIMQVMSNKKKVNVYCGIERYTLNSNLLNEDSLSNIATDQYKGYKNDLIITKGHHKIYVNERLGAPFFIMPIMSDIKFIAPVIKK